MAFALKSASGLATLKPRSARVARAPVRRSLVVRASGQPYPRDWLKTDPLVFVLSFAGWTIPSSIGVSAFGGNSLFGLLTSSIGEELAHFPTGPALTDSFWLYLTLWHVGLFLTLVLGQAGVQGRKQGYW